MGDALPDLVKQITKARGNVDVIVKATAKIWPKAPEPILRFGWGSKNETDVTGAGIERAVPERGKDQRVWSYGTPDVFRREIEKHERRIAHIMTTKSKRGLKFETHHLKEAQIALPLSEAYCSEIDRIAKSSGYEQALASKKKVHFALKAKVAAIMDIEPRTMEGVVIQAQAIHAWQSVDPCWRILDLDAAGWPAKMANAVLAQAKMA